MAHDSVAITTSEDLLAALDHFTQTNLKPLFGQLCQEIQTRLQKDIQVELKEISNNWQKFRCDLNTLLQEVKSGGPYSKDCWSEKFSESTDNGDTRKSLTEAMHDMLVPLPLSLPPTVEILTLDGQETPKTPKTPISAGTCSVRHIKDSENINGHESKCGPDSEEAIPKQKKISEKSDGNEKMLQLTGSGERMQPRSSLVACIQCGSKLSAQATACPKCGTKRRRQTFANIMQMGSNRRDSKQAKPLLRRGSTECFNLDDNTPVQQMGFLHPDRALLKRQGTQQTMNSAVLSSHGGQSLAASSTNTHIFWSRTPVPQEGQDGIIQPVQSEFMTRRRCVLRDSVDTSHRKELEDVILHSGIHSREAQILPSEWQDGTYHSPRSSAASHETGSTIRTYTSKATAAVAKKCTLSLKAIVLSSEFDYFAGVAIVLNAVMLGIQTDYMAREFTDEVPTVFQVLEKCFAVVFTVELLLRLFTFRSRFFYMQGWKWNIFDIVVVGIQLIEEFMSLFAPSSGSNNKFGVLRMLRVLRLVRIIRLVRVLRLIGELRTIVVSIMGCMRSLLWTMLLLLLMIYMISVYLTQLVSDHKVENREVYIQSQQNLETYFGSLGTSSITLFGSITGGVNWDQPLWSLMDHISPWLSVVFASYICFALLAMMNVVTGVFVESALENAKRDKDLYLLQHVKKLFKDVDKDGNGAVSWAEFHSQLGNPNMKVYFEACDLDVKEAENLFVLLDVDQSGFIDADEFVNCFFKLRGTAKAIDLAMLSYGFERLGRRFKEVEDTLKELRAALIPSSEKDNSLDALLDCPTLEDAALEDAAS